MTPSVPNNVYQSSKTGNDNYFEQLSIRLTDAQPRYIDQIDVFQSIRAIIIEWLAIMGAIALCHQFWSPLLYVLTIMFIGAGQHALAVLQHDAAHYRLLPSKRWNDWIAEGLLSWPILHSTQWFRSYHFSHHRNLGTPQDGNRAQYLPHTQAGKLRRPWTFPKTPSMLGLWLLLRISGLFGLIHVGRSVRRILTYGSLGYRLLLFFYYAITLSLIFAFQSERLFYLYWMIPLGTWFVMTNLLRIAGEHSAIQDSNGFYNLTRTTLPSWFDQIFIVPHNISYHLEHHLYPHIPFHQLPELHRRLMTQTEYRQQAHVSQGYGKVLGELAKNLRSS